MGERERAVVATAMVTAMRKLEPRLLDPVIEELGSTPWDVDVTEMLKAVRRELERQKHATKPKR